MAIRRTAVFTIASKNYLAYVRVLLKSIAEVHPEYALYLFLADTVDGAFDPEAEVFETIQSDQIGIPHFEDMALRYDIMEFNTAIKPFAFQWMFDHTDVDNIIYLDPDIRIYSRLEHIEAAFAAGSSVVLTPHITRPIEDGKSPADYNMLQAGVFNLGFAAIARCDDARRFVEWWGRRLQTQACVDFAHNLFTDQRWCDLAPCLVDRLHVLKSPGYNVAYWNLTERRVSQQGGHWLVNGEPLAFYHFSGINVAEQGVLSKHQDRFDFRNVPGVKPLFDAYRERVLEEGWQHTRQWPYAYSKTRDGLDVPTVVRLLYRECSPEPRDFGATGASEALISLCNGVSTTVSADRTTPITRLMEHLYRLRPDLQAAFDLRSRDGRNAFRSWFSETGARECKLPPELVPRYAPVAAATPPGASVPAEPVRGVRAGRANAASVAAPVVALTGVGGDGSLDAIWMGLPTAVRRCLAPAVHQWLDGTAPGGEPRVTRKAVNAAGRQPGASPGGRIAALRDPAPLEPLAGDGRRITVLMHAIWCSRADLRLAFDLDTVEGRSGLAGWFDASAAREYGVGESTGGSAASGPGPLPGANLVGYAHAEIGMGEHVRMSAAALAGTSVRYGVVNFDVGVVSRQQATLDHGEVLAGNPYAANIFHVNADQMFVAYRHLGEDFFANRYNIGYWAWELAGVPLEFMAAAKLVDEIWAPSRFIQQAFGHGADIPVEYMPLCVTLPEFQRADRRRFDLPDSAYLFLYTFDFLSFPDRKNPLAAIRAFRQAFPDRSADVGLVIKVMHGRNDSPQWLDMLRAIDGDPRIRIINRTLSRSEVLALLDLCDCFVSLHRSEGFGRGPAEAMYLGKPVIVTNYSGNTDFTLADNSCLVDYELIAVGEGQYPFHSGQQWADADVDHAAWYMRRLHADRDHGRALGARARAHMLEHYSQRAIGARYEARLRQLGLA